MPNMADRRSSRCFPADQSRYIRKGCVIHRMAIRIHAVLRLPERGNLAISLLLDFPSPKHVPFGVHELRSASEPMFDIGYSSCRAICRVSTYGSRHGGCTAPRTLSALSAAWMPKVHKRRSHGAQHLCAWFACKKLPVSRGVSIGRWAWWAGL